MALYKAQRSWRSLLLLSLIVILAAVLLLSMRDAPEAEITAVEAKATNEFLDSIGVVSTFPDRGQPVDKTIEMLRYGGFRWVRAGIEGLREGGPTTVETFLKLHREAGVKINWGLVSGGSDLDRLIETGRELANAGALLAFEGNNEPNNWPVRYQGEIGGGTEHSWLPLAKLHRDLYERVKSDPVLKDYPVWSLSEPGAQVDNVGLQFLTIPPDAETLMPAGTRYADYANVHNYIYHPSFPDHADNKVWNATDVTPAARVNGLYGNFGLTWRNRFKGYTQKELFDLPRVTTETGVKISDKVTEEMHALHLMNLYLAQFKRGYSYTSVYLLRDRTDEAGNQAFGFFRPDYAPRTAAHYLHNLTTILADDQTMQSTPGALGYAIVDQPETVHDLLLQHSDGAFQLVVWAERLNGSDDVTIKLAEEAGTVTLYDPTIGTQPIETLEGITSIDLSLTNHPVIIEIPAQAE